MRLLFLNHNLREHGTYFRAFHLARELVRRGHEVTLWTASEHHWYRPAESEQDGVHILETPSWSPLVSPDDGWGLMDVLFRLGRMVRERFDLLYVFAHPPNVYLPMRLAQLLGRGPVVVDWCDVYRDGIFPLREEIRAYRRERGWRVAIQRATESVEKRLERGILHHAQGVTVISKELARATLAEGIPPDCLLHYPSGANLDAIAPRDKAECRRALGIEGDAPLLGYIANYNPDERFFLAALARVFRRHPRARLLSAAPPFTPSLVEQEGIAANLIELGRLPFAQMTTVLGAADLLALPLEENPSNRGRWPNKFGDYLAAGRPIVSNAVGDIPDYFAPLDSPDAVGIVSAPTVAAFGDAMADLTARPDRWSPLGAASRRLAETRLDWAVLAAQVEPFLEEIRVRSSKFEVRS